MTTNEAQWEDAQAGEVGYWGNCLGMRAWGEFVKQEMYGREMGVFDDYGDNGGELDMRGKSVLDVGGGPVSMTLRCYNAHMLVVVDPINWPASVYRRYRRHDISFVRAPGEELPSGGLYDEVWIYNVLQHVQDPLKVLANARQHIKEDGGVLRIFEWLWIPADTCHPHVLTPELLLNGLLGLRVKKFGIPVCNDYWSNGAKAFVGVFTR